MAADAVIDTWNNLHRFHIFNLPRSTPRAMTFTPNPILIVEKTSNRFSRSTKTANELDIPSMTGPYRHPNASRSAAFRRECPPRVHTTPTRNWGLETQAWQYGVLGVTTIG